MGWLRRLIDEFDKKFSPRTHRRKQMLRVPLARISDVPEQTPVRIAGRVRLHESATVTSPLTDRACVHYAVQVIAFGQGRHGEAEVELGSELGGVPFLLDDGGGTALVDPSMLDATLRVDQRTGSKAMFDADPAQRAIFQRCCPDTVDWFPIRGLEFRETYLVEGDEIAVVGNAIRDVAPDLHGGGLYRAESATRLRFSGSRAHPLLLSDEPRVRMA